jgi:MFS family permease
VRPNRLPRALWLVVAGILVNYLGYGAVLPFEVIYLHDGRGFGLGLAGLAVGLLSGVAVVTAPVAGPMIDRYGARAVAAVGAVGLATGYAVLAVAHTPAVALIAAAVAGAGNGALNPSQSTLVATIVPARLRHRATAVSRVAANVGAGIGGGLGGLVAVAGLSGFVVLFLANAVSYLILAGILLAAVPQSPSLKSIHGYAQVLRDRAFVRVALTNVAMIAVGWGVFTWLVPPYAERQLGLRAPLIGLLLLANAATVAVAQVPIARLAEGRSRAGLMGLAAGLFVVACLLVLGASLGERPYPALLAAVILVGIGECCHTTVLMPLVADLAPDAVRGRYMAAAGLSWWIGLAVAPALGAPLLGVSPAGAFLAATAVAAAAGVSALTLRLPEAARRTPRQGPALLAE